MHQTTSQTDPPSANVAPGWVSTGDHGTAEVVTQSQGDVSASVVSCDTRLADSCLLPWQ